MMASLSDAAIEKQFGAWLDDCTKQNSKNMVRDLDGIPAMTKWTDLDQEAIEFYKDEQFGQSEEFLKAAAAENDAFAIYLLKAADPLSVSDACKRECQTAIDAVLSILQVQQTLTCSDHGGILEEAINCMRVSKECVISNFFV